jgi:hypothetical protein
MMTKTALKALWLGGGGVLATWLAVTPNQGVPSSATTAAERPAETREPSEADWKAQADRLRTRTAAVTPRGAARNPFRFVTPKSGGDRAGSRPSPAVLEPTLTTAPSLPSWTLSGVAEKITPAGVARTAVITADGQIYLVGAGDSVGGRYTVVAIDREAVILRDADGAELRLSLP